MSSVRCRRFAAFVGWAVCLWASKPSTTSAQSLEGREANRTSLIVYEVDRRSSKVVAVEPRLFGAPNWSPDGKNWYVNGGGKLWRVPSDGNGHPEAIPIPSVGWIDINHGVSPDGKTLAFTSGALLRAPVGGGAAKKLVDADGSYFHGWSPDGKTITYSSNRANNLDLYAVAGSGGAERRLTADPAIDDTSEYSPDGRWVYFNSNRSGNFEIWRTPAEDAGATEKPAERITFDDREDWWPHPSPDGKWLIYLSYPPKTGWHYPDRDVSIRKVKLPEPGAKLDPKTLAASNEEAARFVGGHGSLGASPWSPDSRRFVFAAFDPPPPTARIVFLTPSDVAVPAGAAERLTDVAAAAERFLLEGMKRQGYPPGVDHLFARQPGGKVEVIYVKGGQPSSDPKSKDPAIHAEAIRQAKRQAKVAGEGHAWWVFVDLGPPPVRFADWKGSGDPVEGGWAIVNYDSTPGVIRPDAGLSADFNADFALKGTIHEFGHALGLPHVGPNLALGLGNSLMGANNSVYLQRKYSKPDQVYLTESSAAMLWKHPLFSGITEGRSRLPDGVKLLAFKPTYSRTTNRITINGQVTAAPMPHSVIIRDDLGRPQDEYWHLGHTARVAADGTFNLTIDRPTKADGHYQVVFAFPNGMTTGDGLNYSTGTRGAVEKSYRFRNGVFQFGN